MFDNDSIDAVVTDAVVDMARPSARGASGCAVRSIVPGSTSHNEADDGDTANFCCEARHTNGKTIRAHYWIKKTRRAQTSNWAAQEETQP